MNNFDPNDDRFADLSRPSEEGNELVTQGQAMVAPLVAERPMGAQRLAVMRRPVGDILAEIKALGSAAGKDWYYRFPVKKKVKNEATGRDEWMTDYIEGPSIKLANDLARTFGNCDVDVRVVEDPGSWVFYARFVDLQTGFSMTRPFQQRKSQESVRGATDRQRDIAFQIGASKAIRNIICNALQTYADYALEQAQQSIVERFAKDLPSSRARALERTKERGWDIKLVERVIGKVAAEWLAPDLAKVSAMYKAIDDGMISFNECFPPPNAPAVENPLGPGIPLTEAAAAAQAQMDYRKAADAAAEAASNAVADELAKKLRQTEHVRAKAASAKLPAEARADAAETQIVANRQQKPADRSDPREMFPGLRRKAASETSGSGATSPPPAFGNAQAASVHAREMDPHDRTALKPGISNNDPEPSGGYYQEALAFIANAVAVVSLAKWWKDERSARLAAGMTAQEMQQLTDTYWSKHIKLSEGE